MPPQTGTIEILLVEDNPADARLTREALLEGKVRSRVAVVSDGVEALAYLRRQGDFAGVPRPDLVLLDLNLPRKSGIEVLKERSKDPDLRLTPVVVLTTSEAEADVTRSYELQANAYVIKPVALHEFLEVVKAVENFWVQVVRLPPK